MIATILTIELDTTYAFDAALSVVALVLHGFERKVQKRFSKVDH